MPCRDGLERVEVADKATLHDLREAIQSKLQIPYHGASLLTAHLCHS